MQLKFILLSSLLVTFIANQPNLENRIPIKPVMQSIPQIDNTYSIVHTLIYPKATDDRFKASLPADYFVKKALENKNKKQINTVNNQKQNNFGPSAPISTKDIQLNPLNPQEKQPKRGPISTSLLAENSKQTIAWAVPKLNPLTPFVVENGVQHQIVQVFPQKPPTVQYLQEGKPPAQPVTRPRPQNIKKQPQLVQPQKQSKSQIPPLVQPQNPKKITVNPQANISPQADKKLKIDNKGSQDPSERFEKHRSNLIWIILGVIILILVFVVIRSQRKQKISSLSILHSRLENYKIQQQDQDEDIIAKNNSSSLQDEDSDEQNQPKSFYRNPNQL